ncbi:PREDICTED: auxin-repressed 12.5 kDa protein-like isoform X4 [Populus euphratica]|uniref:Auxin-repressed 12.5 kDa protein-like isoform X4 n=1 Tax=Populus euphratica TaxID=75702 RepID=A0AAJ6UWG9_POPEU|nr:PREDICTED: auxin-repressed 12.5 kDa protein-like isoform X4 [Populus euphratica]
MSLLDQLWDDTVAGPLPESGLGKLRKMPSSGLRPNPGKESGGGSVMKSYREEATTVDEKRVTRSIMIVRPPGYTNVSSTTPPASPAGSTPPVSPFAGSRESFRFRRRSTSDAYEKPTEVGPRNPTSPYGV